MDVEMLKLLGSGTLAAALLYLIYLVGMRLVKAIDGIGVKVDQHTALDMEHHARVGEAIVRVEGKVDAMMGVESTGPVQRVSTPAGGIRIVRGNSRPSTKSDE